VGSRAYDLVWGTTLRATTSFHKLIDRLSGGRLGRRFPGGAQVVWITTLGRRSGEWRRTPLLAVPTNGDWGIAGSNAGQEKVPGWVFNVRAHAEGSVEIDGQSFPARFTEVHGEQAEEIYRALTESWSAYDMYARNIQRDIPVFVIEVADGQEAIR